MDSLWCFALYWAFQTFPFSILKLFTYYNCVYGACVLSCGGQRSVWQSRFTLPTFPWVPGSRGKHLYPLRHLPSPRDSQRKFDFLCPTSCSHLQAYGSLFSPMVCLLEKLSSPAPSCPAPPPSISLCVALIRM